MATLPSRPIITKSIAEALNRLENDEDNLFWKLTRSQDSFSMTDSEVTGRTTTAKPVRSRRRKRRSHSALNRSRKRHARLLEKEVSLKNGFSFARREEHSRGGDGG